MKLTGISPAIFYVMGILLAGSGIFFFISLFPLLGLAPQDKRTLVVLPTGVFLWSVLSIMVAYLFVPGSPIDVQYHLGHEIIASAYYRPIFMGLIGAFLAVIHVTLYHSIYPRLPAGLRTEKVSLSWIDLWYPGLLFLISMILGLIVIL
jgi:hypothetical protein